MSDKEILKRKEDLDKSYLSEMEKKNVMDI